MIGHDNTCFLCGRNGSADPLDTHHIFGGNPNRKHSEEYGLAVKLCHDKCHENGPNAVHKNKAVMDYLHKVGQKRFERDHSRNDFINAFGRNYL